ncbi:lipocalin family protein [candidate division KSB1 bacterium]|nr:lipocalin family protein [candidate division KSB1 bacterium]
MLRLLVLLLLFLANNPITATEPQVVESVDLDRYTGLWFEIARIPNRFQKQCTAGTTARYTLMEDGPIRVVNSCYKEDGSKDRVTGLAKVVDVESNAKLQVSFLRFLGKQWFWGDYWIIGLDEEYKWAVIGHPERKYGWILSRTPEISDSLRQNINGLLNQQGYNPDLFENTLPFKGHIKGGQQ